MYLRTLSQSRQQLSNIDVQDRALELAPTFSIDWDMELDQFSNEGNFPAQIGMNETSIIMRPQLMTEFQNLPSSLNLNLSEQSSNQEDSSIDLSPSQQNQSHHINHEHNWSGHQRNFLIISRNDHINEDDFLEAIDFLFKQIHQVKTKPKFRHIINRMKTKCSICLNKIKRSQTICQTSCRHKFHKDCLEQWTEKNPSCPLCRTKFE